MLPLELQDTVLVSVINEKVTLVKVLVVAEDQPLIRRTVFARSEVFVHPLDLMHCCPGV